MSVAPDDIDRMLINRVQEDIPLAPHPFATLGAELGLSEETVLERLEMLRADGILTRFGPFFDAQALGGEFCLCALAVPEARFDEVTALVNAHPEVAHNYRREHRLNMWFVLATEEAAEIDMVADRIEAETGLSVLRFPKEREFFIGFRVAA